MASIFAAIINRDSDILAKVSASLKSQVYKIANKFTIILLYHLIQFDRSQVTLSKKG